ncbi:hypothetical protein LVJ94_19125 [Pendulispora rubella]|uniref:Nudix hydrolase 3 n=1 Tax=Pendulispora rubella TaxID=2741070 RepID=A0ABZ2LEG6_9BACT
MNLSRSPLSVSGLAMLAMFASACGGGEETGATPPPAAPAPPAPVATAPAAPPKATIDYGALERDEVNRRALHHNLPLYWVADKNDNKSVDPDEVVSLLFYSGNGTRNAPRWVENGKFTPAFEAAFSKLLQGEPAPKADLSAAEGERRKLIAQDLDQGFPTLVRSDLTALSADEKNFVRHVFAAADLVDTLYLTQKGVLGLEKNLPADDPASAALFFRNRGPKCAAPKTEKNPACNAIPGTTKVPVDVYPRPLQTQAKFCETLEKAPNAKKLLEPFSAVREIGGKLEPVPYGQAYKELTSAIANELRAAAGALTDAKESALKAYVTAAAQAFTDDNWLPADEAWSKMNAQNSKFYLRIGPDETYWEPCAHKAGFHVAFALINRDSLIWQEKLTPVQQEMEQNLATRIGAPYKARKVTFHLPDFIDIIINTGDDRQPIGGTAGQSLPNWGPVANEGRGRTMVMSNLFADPDSLRFRRRASESLLTKSTMGLYDDDPKASLLSVILHEATHNLGPHADYVYQGKTGPQAFGGSIAAMMEELKAQTGALYFTDFLKKKNIISAEVAMRSYVSTLGWTFGQISRGMYTSTGERKPYSQLAAIQLGILMDEGAVTFDPNAPAANGKDQGAFTVHPEKMVAAVEKMAKTVGAIKAAGNKDAALALTKKYVDGKLVPIELIITRVLREPKAALVYAVDL